MEPSLDRRIDALETSINFLEVARVTRRVDQAKKLCLCLERSIKNIEYRNSLGELTLDLYTEEKSVLEEIDAALDQLEKSFYYYSPINDTRREKYLEALQQIGKSWLDLEERAATRNRIIEEFAEHPLFRNRRYNAIREYEWSDDGSEGDERGYDEPDRQ